MKAPGWRGLQHSVKKQYAKIVSIIKGKRRRTLQMITSITYAETGLDKLLMPYEVNNHMLKSWVINAAEIFRNFVF